LTRGVQRKAPHVAIFVRQIGGTITVSNADGAGTIVRIRLPSLVTAQLKGLSA
jgi:K+-sensing histidine kinase KdpD